MPRRAPKKVIRELRELRKFASLETATFGFPSESVTLSRHRGRDVVDQPVTEFIKEETRVHRNTWILPKIDRLIAWAEGKDEPDFDY